MLIYSLFAVMVCKSAEHGSGLLFHSRSSRRILISHKGKLRQCFLLDNAGEVHGILKISAWFTGRVHVFLAYAGITGPKQICSRIIAVG